MPVSRKNKAKRVGGRSSTELWFKANSKRVRNRNKQAKLSRKKNR
jgi:hypothetical protein